MACSNNKRTARRHVRTHGTEHANRRKTTHEQGARVHRRKDKTQECKGQPNLKVHLGRARLTHLTATPKLLRESGSLRVMLPICDPEIENCE